LLAGVVAVASQAAHRKLGFLNLQSVDVQSSLIHSRRGYDDETGVGTPNGPLFFLVLPFAARH
jgi:hypothetical protein